MEPKPFQRSLSSSSGGGPRKKDDDHKILTVKKSLEGESSSMKLSVGIGGGCGAAVIKHGKPLLTAAQLDELQRQVVIYEYITAGLPVPSALVRPIWKSVSDSLRFAHGASGIHRRFPSFARFSKEFDFGNMMDPEPERCRRTDGKKWRCRKGVVPGQKYCEQHMHRGCRRSRKAVESSQTITTSNATLLNDSSNNLEHPDTNSFCSAPAGTPSDSGISHKNSGATTSNVDFKIMGTNMSISVVSSSKSISTSMILKNTASCIKAAPAVHTDSTITKATVRTNKSGNNSNYKTNSIGDRNGNCSKYVNLKNQIDRGNNIRSIKNANAAPCQGLNFSPKSVLQAQGCNSACLCRSGELELRRCRRTDGKKWRCRRDVVPNEKYCKMHMHRGAKKRVIAYKAAPDTSTSCHLNPTANLRSNADSSNLNMNLCIAVFANPQLQTKDNMNASEETTISCSSDTTISDAIIATCDDREISS